MSPLLATKAGDSAQAYGMFGAAGLSVTGGTLSSDATYFYRAFTGTSNLVVKNGNLTADVMIIAGGASGANGGGSNGSGGGGAGGLLYQAGLSLTPNTYTCTIGGGGASSTVNDGNAGTNSSFSSYLVVVELTTPVVELAQ